MTKSGNYSVFEFLDFMKLRADHDYCVISSHVAISYETIPSTECLVRNQWCTHLSLLFESILFYINIHKRHRRSAKEGARTNEIIKLLDVSLDLNDNQTRKACDEIGIELKNTQSAYPVGNKSIYILFKELYFFESLLNIHINLISFRLGRF